LRVGEGVSGRVITERQPIYVPDTQAEIDFLYFDPQIRSLLVVPLIVRDEVIGTLSIDDVKPKAFDNELRLLTINSMRAWSRAMPSCSTPTKICGTWTR